MSPSAALTFDANNNLNVWHNMPTLISMRSNTELRFINCVLKFINPNYAGIDVHGCNYCYFTGCTFDCGGSGNPPIFLGTAHAGLLQRLQLLRQLRLPHLHRRMGHERVQLHQLYRPGLQ